MAQITDVNTRSLANPSARTIAERKKFAGLVDEFATFTWDNIDMFNEFGAFIINDKKGSLKFYNGASFKNEYSKPQFQDGYTNISGISFDTQKISFQVGIYWISIEDYRILMNFLHPYKVSFLSFSFEKQYGYQCKLAEIKDSTRYTIGKEGTQTSTASTNLNYSHLMGGDAQGYRYYTELQLTFEVIGSQCAKSLNPYIHSLTRTSDASTFQYHLSRTETGEENDGEFVVSDLAMPVQIDFNVTGITGEITISGVATAQYMGLNPVNSAILFNLTLKNLKSTDNISLTYDSEQGLIYWSTQDKKNIISLLSTSDTGMRIVKSLDVKQFYWPGQLDHKEILEASKDIIITADKALSYISYFRQQRTNII